MFLFSSCCTADCLGFDYLGKKNNSSRLFLRRVVDGLQISIGAGAGLHVVRSHR
jgi:hypothetical protein